MESVVTFRQIPKKIHKILKDLGLSLIVRQDQKTATLPCLKVRSSPIKTLTFRNLYLFPISSFT